MIRGHCLDRFLHTPDAPNEDVQHREGTSRRGHRLRSQGGWHGQAPLPGAPARDGVVPRQVSGTRDVSGPRAFECILGCHVERAPPFHQPVAME